MQTTDIGRAFFHVIRLRRGSPLLHTAQTVATEPPFRRSQSLIVRIPIIPRLPVLRDLPLMDRALVLGWWQDVDWTEEEALMAAVHGWGVDPYDDDLEDPEVRQVIRENIAKQGLEPDDEWKVISVLGVDR